MSKFVNLKKRSVSLPKGCKDLIDVLPPQLPESAVSGAANILGSQPECKIDEVSAGFDCLKHQIADIFGSPQALEFLQIGSASDPCLVGLIRYEGDNEVVAVVQVSQEEKISAVQSLFESHGAEPYPSAKAAALILKMGNILRYYRLPSGAPEAAKLIEILLTEVLEVPRESDLKFSRVAQQKSP